MAKQKDNQVSNIGSYRGKTSKQEKKIPKRLVFEIAGGRRDWRLKFRSSMMDLTASVLILFGCYMLLSVCVMGKFCCLFIFVAWY